MKNGVLINLADLASDN